MSFLIVFSLVLACAAAWQAFDSLLAAYRKIFIGGEEKSLVASRNIEEIQKDLDMEKSKTSGIIGKLGVVQSFYGEDGEEHHKKKREVPEKIILVKRNADTQDTQEVTIAGLDTSSSRFVREGEAVIKKNEAEAIELLKRYSSAQKTYYEHYGKYARSEDLIINKEGKFEIIDPQLGNLNSARDIASAFNGYYYHEVLSNTGSATAFVVFAIPVNYKKTGRNTICIKSNLPEKVLIKDLEGNIPQEDTATDSWNEI
ncbi:MAG: hypothetical protein ABII88_11655 [Candidatus Omnitrophota bacterium]